MNLPSPIGPEPVPLPILEIPVVVGATRGLGRLLVSPQEGRVSLPLCRVAITACVADRIAEVTVEQVFRNPYREHLEAVYVFPLPGGAAVSRFELRVGDRVIVGKVQECGDARKQYRAAVEQGRRAALLEEERDDVFTVQVGNLPPGEEVCLLLVCSERLPFFEDGSTEIRLPLVVAPRYIPGTPVDGAAVGEGTEADTDVVPDASRITPPRLVAGFDPKVDLRVAVHLLTGDGMGPADLRCSQHATRLHTEIGMVRVDLARVDEPLDRDFVLRWRMAGEGVRSRFLLHQDDEGRCHGLLSLVPPARDGFLGNARDVVFVLDRSGSMSGLKMSSAARACATLLETLGPRDRFAIQAFDSIFEWFEPHGPAGSRFLEADEPGLERGQRYLRNVEARGGTELDGAMSEAIGVLASRGASDGRVPVIVLLTDGQIGDENRLLRRLQRELGDTRVFTVGIDTAVNSAFLTRLAAVGGGTATFVTPGIAVEDALRDVGREIGNPLVVNLSLVDAGCGVEAASLAPARVPDLFAGRACAVFFSCRGAGRVRVQGTWADGAPFAQVVEAEEVDLPALAQLWARARVTDLGDRFRARVGDTRPVQQEIVELSVRHSLLTRFTAFVVVDQAEIVNLGGETRTVVQTVEKPAAWEHTEESVSRLERFEEPASFRRSVSRSGPPGEPIRREEVKADPVPSPELLAALRALGHEVAAAWRELQAEGVPSADALERARKRLLEVLAESDAGCNVPKLQKYLRATAVELVSALGTPGVTIPFLLQLFESRLPDFLFAWEEAERVWGCPFPTGDASPVSAP